MDRVEPPVKSLHSSRPRGIGASTEYPVLNSREAAQAKFGCMLRRHALAFDTNRGWNPGIMLQPASGQRDWPAARDNGAESKSVRHGWFYLDMNLRRLSSLRPAPLRRLSSLPS